MIKAVQKFAIAINPTVINKAAREDSTAWERLATKFENCACTLEDIKTAINLGYAITTQHTDRRKAENFTAGQHIGIDFDHLDSETSVYEHPFVKEFGSIIYHTASSTPDVPRMRVLFVLDSPITDATEYRQAVLAVMAEFGQGAEADKQCKDPCRLFFGSKGSNPTVTGRLLPRNQLSAMVKSCLQKQEQEKPTRHARPLAVPVQSNDASIQRFLTKTLDTHCDNLRTIQRGDRHEAALKYARTWGGYLATYPHLLDESEIERRLIDAKMAQGADLRESENAIRDGIRHGKDTPLTVTTDADFFAGRAYDTPALVDFEGDAIPIAQDIEQKHHLTDLGNTRRLVQHFGSELRHVGAWGWLVWNGRCWELDKTKAAERYAQKTVKEIHEEAGRIENDGDRKAVAAWAMKSESNSRLNAILEKGTSQAEIVARPESFDRNPWILNCRNGTLDLKTGDLKPHNRADLITKVVPVEFDPAAECPIWERFIDQITDYDRELSDYLQRAVGYSLTGDTSEQCLFFCYGMGANGKSVFLETLQTLLGSFAQAANPTTFLAKDSGGDGPRNDIAALAGARLVKAVETEAGRRWAEALIKELTGEDMITARFLFKEDFRFKPAFKLWFSSNHKPVVIGQDNGIWRRIRLIPFSVTIAPESQDKNLATKLRSELPGILAWAVRGCLLWQAGDLKEPKKVREATQGYREESDSLKDFLEECCIKGNADKHRVTLNDCFKRYSNWTTENCEKPMNKRALSQALGERGFVVSSGAKNKTTVFGLNLKIVENTTQASNEDENALTDF